MWTRLSSVVAKPWALAPLGSLTRLGCIVAGYLLLVSACASSGPPRVKQPESPIRDDRDIYFRSPTRDYVEPLPSVSDGQIMGADERLVDDRILVGPTWDHPAPGWFSRYGFPAFDEARTRVGYGVLIEGTTCEAPAHGPSLPGEREAQRSMQLAWSNTRRSALPIQLAQATLDSEPEPVSAESVSAESVSAESIQADYGAEDWLSCR
jgi:hypothetical protein